MPTSSAQKYGCVLDHRHGADKFSKEKTSRFAATDLIRHLTSDFDPVNAS